MPVIKLQLEVEYNEEDKCINFTHPALAGSLSCTAHNREMAELIVKSLTDTGPKRTLIESIIDDTEELIFNAKQIKELSRELFIKKD